MVGTFSREDAVTLLGETHPFDLLVASSRLSLAAALTPLQLRPRETIFRRGQSGDELYLVVSGQVAESTELPDGQDAPPVVWGRGRVVGAVGAITQGARDQTVIALEETVLCAVRSEALSRFVQAHPTFGARLRELGYLRVPLHRQPGVVAHPRAQAQQPLLLQNRQGRYFKLDEPDVLVWDLLDGQRSVADLMLASLEAQCERLRSGAPKSQPSSVSGGDDGGCGNPSRILRLCLRLQEAGFIQGLTVRPEMSLAKAPGALWRRVSGWGRLLFPLRGVDAAFQWLYRHLGFVAFRPAIQLLLAIVLMVGLTVFITSAPSVEALRALPRQALPWIYVAGILSMCLHEFGHALATVWCGCRVQSIGVGWFWFGPVAFVDTSDVWRAPRAQRIVVSLAGPYVTLLIASVLSLSTLWLHGWTAQVAWIVASANYLGALFNLNPLLKLDGYYVLSDLLDRPNLRAESLRWIWHQLLPTLRRPAGLWSHRFDLAYGGAALIYFGAFVGLTVGPYRAELASFLASLVGPAAGTWLSIALTVLPAGLGCAEIASELAPRPLDSELV